MVKRSRLADLVGLGDIEDTLRQSILDAADEVADRFRQVLVQLQNDSESGAFVGYEVVIDTEPYTVTKRNLGNLSLVRCHIYVQSPDPDLNLFDLLDAGRPDLPERPPGESPYPLWNLRDPRLVHRPGERRSRREADVSRGRGPRPVFAGYAQRHCAIGWWVRCQRMPSTARHCSRAARSKQSRPPSCTHEFYARPKNLSASVDCMSSLIWSSPSAKAEHGTPQRQPA